MEEEYCPAHVYRSFQEFHGLDDLDIRFIVVDWEAGRKSFMWGNRALLRAFNMTQDELNAWNFQDQSPAASEHHRSVWQAVQVDKGRIERLKTAYPKGKPITAIQSFRPIEIQLADWPDQRTVMLMELKEPPETPASESNNSDESKNTNWGFAEELLRYTEVMTMVFDAKTEELEYANQSCRYYYAVHAQGLFGRTGSSGGDARWTLAEAFKSFLFDDGQAKHSTLEQIRALALTSPRLEFECQKAKSGREGADDVRWHKVHVQACVNPATGLPALIINEYEVTALKVQAEQLVAASQSQEQFFAAISHELRTPLNGIIGLSESLLACQTCDERMEMKLELIKNSGLRLNGLVSDILDAASAKRAAFTVKHHPVDLLPICQSVVALLTPLIHSNCVVLLNQVDSALPLIRGDKDRITQILLNLVSNAIKFTEQGSITLSAAPLADSEVLVEVTDTGMGIPADKLDQVWAPFKQVDMSTTRKYGGTGLGLSLVKEMVEAHGGRVGLRSQHGGPNSGATFFFVLPISQSTSLPDDQPDSVSSPHFPVETAEMLAEHKTAQLGAEAAQMDATCRLLSSSTSSSRCPSGNASPQPRFRSRPSSPHSRPISPPSRPLSFPASWHGALPSTEEAEPTAGSPPMRASSFVVQSASQEPATASSRFPAGFFRTRGREGLGSSRVDPERSAESRAAGSSGSGAGDSATVATAQRTLPSSSSSSSSSSALPSSGGRAASAGRSPLSVSVRTHSPVGGRQQPESRSPRHRAGRSGRAPPPPLDTARPQTDMIWGAPSPTRVRSPARAEAAADSGQASLKPCSMYAKSDGDRRSEI